MHTIKLTVRTDSTGILNIETPTELNDTLLEVLLVYEQVKDKPPVVIEKEMKFPPGFAKLYGAAGDYPLARVEDLFEEDV